jgi:hypothetical protein
MKAQFNILIKTTHCITLGKKHSCNFIYKNVFGKKQAKIGIILMNEQLKNIFHINYD